MKSRIPEMLILAPPTMKSMRQISTPNQKGYLSATGPGSKNLGIFTPSLSLCTFDKAVFLERCSLYINPCPRFRLWQTFLVNVDPLVKIFHAPTIQQTVLDASTNLRNIPKHVEALLFSIYFIAVTSMQPNECESLLGSSKPDLLVKYSHGAQQALVNARFMRSLNLTTLNAFIIYLVSLASSIVGHMFSNFNS